MEKWRLEQFQTLLGTPVVAKTLNGDSEFELNVSEVNESKSLGEGWESFAVIFSSALEMSQGNVQLTHPDYGNTTVFLNPKSETEYEAIFSYQI